MEIPNRYDFYMKILICKLIILTRFAVRYDYLRDIKKYENFIMKSNSRTHSQRKTIILISTWGFHEFWLNKTKKIKRSTEPLIAFWKWSKGMNY